MAKSENEVQRSVYSLKNITYETNILTSLAEAHRIVRLISHRVKTKSRDRTLIKRKSVGHLLKLTDGS